MSEKIKANIMSYHHEISSMINTVINVKMHHIIIFQSDKPINTAYVNSFLDDVNDYIENWVKKEEVKP